MTKPLPRRVDSYWDLSFTEDDVPKMRVPSDLPDKVFRHLENLCRQGKHPDLVFSISTTEGSVIGKGSDVYRVAGELIQPLAICLQLNDVQKKTNPERVTKMMDKFKDSRSKNNHDLVTLGILSKVGFDASLPAFKRIEQILGTLTSMAGGGPNDGAIFCDMARYLKNRDRSNHNHIRHLMARLGKEVPSEASDPSDSKLALMDYYFQLHSIKMQLKSLSIIASTLANQGRSPARSDSSTPLVAPNIIDKVLQLMMDEMQHHFKMRIPFKCANSGEVGMLIIPRSFGLAIGASSASQLITVVKDLTNLFELDKYAS